MEAEPQSQSTPEERERSIAAVLAAYRERRRRRRGEDTFFGSLDCLISAAEPATRERKSDLLEEAREAGMPEPLADMLYDIAHEEGLDPGLAFDLVRSGIGVAPPPGGVSNAAQVPVSDPHLPEWFFQPSPPDELLRERMLRISFRRFRSLLEQHPEVEDAFRAFADEPDVGYFGY